MSFAPSPLGHSWNFRRIGGIFQPEIKSPADLAALKHLDPKLWVALSCPVNDLEIDRKTLALIDADKDGRVRIEELLDAVNWTLERLASANTLFEGGALPLAAIADKDDESKALKASALQILENIGKPEAAHITVEEAANTEKIYGLSNVNGDGVIAADAATEPAVQSLISEIIASVGAEQDRNGQPGITQAKLDQFLEQLKAYEAWWALGESDSAQGADVFPLGDHTPAAFTSLQAVEQKIDDYFARCQLAAFDPRSEESLNQDIGLFKSIANQNLSTHNLDIEALPLARVSAACQLKLTSVLNPAWDSRISDLHDTVLKPLSSKSLEVLDLPTWKSIKARFAAYRKWRQAKPDTGVEPLGILRIRELLSSDCAQPLNDLLEADRVLAPKMKAVNSVEKLARYHRDLIQVLNNYVNFNDFYSENTHAIFQAGELYLDGRECRLCLKVDNPAKHSALASLSRAFVAYCECRRADSPSTFNIAAIFSNGDSANLIVGRNGVFRDREGKLWDTTIVRLIENPISIREAFFKPYVRLGRFISDQLEKWAVSRDKAIQKQMETGVETVATGSTENGSKENNKSQQSIGGVAGMIAAGGIALGAIGAGLASLFTTLKGLAWWEFPIVMFGLVLIVSLPSMFIAWLKIRKRTLAPLLDASGWAVNGRTLISFRMGRQLTRRAKIPPEAHCRFDEASGARPWLWAALGITLVAAIAGWLFVFV